jgi:uncharacterized membrane protein YhaH (DUF805 family)
MQALFIFLSPDGRMRPQPFICCVVPVYLLGTASQMLAKPDVIPHSGLWLFAAVQALLIWVWFALHAKRLRDAGRPIGLAAAVSLLYALSVILLVIIGAAFFSTSIAGLDANATSALGLILLLAIYTTLSGAGSYDLTWVVVALLSVLAFVPIFLAVVVTIWAAAKPGTVDKA